jgi:hypothetical protein
MRTALLLTAATAALLATCWDPPTASAQCST